MKFLILLLVLLEINFSLEYCFDTSNCVCINDVLSCSLKNCTSQIPHQRVGKIKLFGELCANHVDKLKAFEGTIIELFNDICPPSLTNCM
jgi:hypothetical protein